MNRLINCSLDNLHLYTTSHIELERFDLEERFPILIAQELKKAQPNNIYVINGPGSFTNLRIGTLSANTANMVSDYQINLYSISKLELYKTRFEKGGPSRFLIWIGQRKNWRLYDCVSGNCETINDITAVEITGLAVDGIVGFEDQSNQITINHLGDHIELGYLGDACIIGYAELPFIKYNLLQPNYMMSPNIG